MTIVKETEVISLNRKALLNSLLISVLFFIFGYFVTDMSIQEFILGLLVGVPPIIIVCYFSIKRAYETREDPNLPFIDGEMLFKMMGLVILWLFILASISYILERVIFKQDLWWI